MLSSIRQGARGKESGGARIENLLPCSQFCPHCSPARPARQGRSASMTSALTHQISELPQPGWVESSKEIGDRFRGQRDIRLTVGP